MFGPKWPIHLQPSIVDLMVVIVIPGYIICCIPRPNPNSSAGRSALPLSSVVHLSLSLSISISKAALVLAAWAPLVLGHSVGHEGLACCAAMAAGALACALGCGAVNPVSGDLAKPVVTSNSISSLVCHRADVSGAPPPTPPVPAPAHPLHVPLPLLIPSFLLGFAS